MPLAVTYDIAKDGPPVALSASLRAAIRLERTFGFTKLSTGIAEGSYSTLAAIVRECASKDDAAAILAIRPIGTLINILRAPCRAVLFSLAGHDIEGDKTPSRNAKPVPYSEFYSRLFRLASGIGWTPAQIYDATPFEIVEAIKGRAELIGGTDTPAEPNDPSATDHSAGIARLRDILGSGRP